MGEHEGDLLRFAGELADLGRAFLRERFAAGLRAEVKDDGTPVTAADRDLEALYRERIAERYPDHGVLGEEHGAHDVGAEHVWVLDPVDGTKAFLAGKPLFVSLIALVRDGRPLLGVIEAPATGDRWVGLEGRATRFNGREVAVAERAPTERSVVVVGELSDGLAPASVARLRDRTGWLLYQLDGYGYGLLANGRVHAVVEAGLGVHDVCALDPVVRGAGGVLRTWDGGPVGLEAADRVVAACDEDQAARVLAALAG